MRQTSKENAMIARNMTILRKQCSPPMSQLDVAKALGISSATIQRAETGKAIISAGLLALLARLYGVDAGEFFRNLPAGAVMTHAKPTDPALGRAYMQSDPVGRNFILAAALFAAKQNTGNAD